MSRTLCRTSSKLDDSIILCVIINFDIRLSRMSFAQVIQIPLIQTGLIISKHNTEEFSPRCIFELCGCYTILIRGIRNNRRTYHAHHYFLPLLPLIHYKIFASTMKIVRHQKRKTTPPGGWFCFLLSDLWRG